MDKRMHDDTKLLFHMDRVMDHFDKGEKVAPLHLDCGISKFCSISCIWCYGYFQKMKRIYIEREPLLNMIEDANTIGVKSISLIGDGEPLCNPHCFEAMTFARDKTKLDLAISTNGVALDTDEKCETILSSCKWMRFCIGAGTRDGYKRLHRKDYFDRVKANIKNIVRIKKEKRYDCEIGLQTVFVPGMMEQDTIDTTKMAIDIGVQYFAIKQYSVPDDGETGMAKCDLNQYDSAETINILKQCEQMGTEDTEIIVKWNIMHNKGKREYKGCPSLPFISEISGDSTWAVCGHFFGGKPENEKYVFGKLSEKRMVDIFNSSRYWDIIKIMRHDFNSQKACRGACRLDKTNEFCWKYLNKPRGVNFI